MTVHVERRPVRITDPVRSLEDARARLDAIVAGHRLEHGCGRDALAHVLESVSGRAALARVTRWVKRSKMKGDGR